MTTVADEARRWLDGHQRGVRRWIALASACGAAATLGFALLAAAIAQVAQGWIDGSSPPAVAFILAAAGALLRGLCLALRDWAGLRAAVIVRAQARGEVLDALARLGPLRARAGDDGALASVAVDQVDALDGYFRRYLAQRKIAVIAPLLVLVLVVPKSWLAAVVLLATAPLIPLFMLLVGLGANEASRQQAGALARLGAEFLDLVRGLPALRLLAAANAGAQRLAEGAQDYRRRMLAVLRLAFLSSAVLEFFAAVSIALVALYLGLALLGRFDAGHYGAAMTLKSALFILLLTPEFYAPLRQLGSDYHARADAQAAAEAVLAVCRLAPPAAAWSGNAAPMPGRAPAIEFDAVSLRYGDGRTALESVSLRIAAGERVALRGASGAGKSSLLALLAGFITPSEGRILIDGVELTSLQRQAWWQRLAWLEQRPEWLRCSVRDNVLLGLDAAEARLQPALQAAGIADLVAALPRGTDSVLGEDEGALSGGQLQRIAVARALAREARLWLLDEPTAHLDADAVEGMFRAIGNASAGATLLLATHTPTLPGWIDRELVFERGQLVDDRRIAAAEPVA